MIALVLGVLLFALFVLFAHNMVGRIPDLELVQLLHSYYLYCLKVLLCWLHPFIGGRLLFASAGFCYVRNYAFAFSRLLFWKLPLEVFSKMGPVSNLVWIAALLCFHCSTYMQRGCTLCCYSRFNLSCLLVLS